MRWKKIMTKDNIILHFHRGTTIKWIFNDYKESGVQRIMVPLRIGKCHLILVLTLAIKDCS
jgi:hypothetical protein